jgi:hypothetical protein
VNFGKSSSRVQTWPPKSVFKTSDIYPARALSENT